MQCVYTECNMCRALKSTCALSKSASLWKLLRAVTLWMLITLTVLLFNESLPSVCSPSMNPSWPYKDESQGQIAISLKRARNRYKQQSAKVWPRIVQGIDWWINTLNCFSWARLHLSSIKHSSIFSPCLDWWQRLIRKHLSMLREFLRGIGDIHNPW